MYPTRRTVPVGDNEEFRLLAGKINGLLIYCGYVQRTHEGSASWLGLANTKWHKETVFKLCHYGADDMAFGVRRSFVEASAPKLSQTKWPIKFGVPPRTDVEFWGFLVRDGEPSWKRIRRVLQGLGVLAESAGSGPTDYHAREKEFDESLDSLGL